jgi:hypothetical protein
VTLAFGSSTIRTSPVPLPYAGLSYLDFDLFGRGIQLSGFFGGTYGQAAWTVPGVFRPVGKLTGACFGIAAQYKRPIVSRRRRAVSREHPPTTGAGRCDVCRPAGARVQLRAGYEVDFTGFEANEDTAPDFVVPADAVVTAFESASTATRAVECARLVEPGVPSGMATVGPAGCR